MTGRDLNAWLGTGDGKEPAPKAPPKSAPIIVDEMSHSLFATDTAWALAFMRLIASRSLGGNRPCA